MKSLFETFIHAWCQATDHYHHQNLKCLNNPTPENVVLEEQIWGRLSKLHSWAAKRWGKNKVGTAIKSRENA